MNPTHPFITILLATLFSISGIAQNLEKGLDYYAKRTEGAVGLKAPAENIDLAIAEFRKLTPTEKMSFNPAVCSLRR